MTELRRATADQAAFRDELLARGLFLDSGVPGLYGRSAMFEDIRRRFDALAERSELPEGDARAFDEALTELGFPKPNPMLAE